jgi:hypothetical protein
MKSCNFKNNLNVKKTISHKYTQNLEPNSISINELVENIVERYNVNKEFDENPLYSALLKSFLLNLSNISEIKNDKSINIERNIASFEIIRDDKSERYFNYEESLYKNEVRFPLKIYILIDFLSEEVDCNNEMLNRELIIMKGITREDILNETPKLRTYLRIVEELDS